MLSCSASNRFNKDMNLVNYLKDHDFGLARGNSGISLEKENRYIVQYRHPIESIVSHYEMRLFHGYDNDTEQSWKRFLDSSLNFWKRFVEKWCLRDLSPMGLRVLRIPYSELCDDPLSVLRRVVEFAPLDGKDPDSERLQAAYDKNTGSFARYVEHHNEGKKNLTKRRDVRDFKYYSEDFALLEETLHSSYLGPLKINTLFT